MIFNSFNFLVFFFILFIFYYIIFKEKTKAQNGLLLAASYFFFGWADWRMIPLLLSATTIFYFLGIAIHKSEEKKASLLTTLGVLLGVGLLLYFKYLNFFIDSFSQLFSLFGLQSNVGTFNIILPLGISFFTFRLISYVVEVQREKIAPTRNFVVFATYISFFPTIMSGPIDRPNNFIPQLLQKRTFNYALIIDGFRQILWGLFQKMVIADNLSGLINNVWGDIENQSASNLVIVAILYSVQMYTDFAGYSHMAIGVGKLLGFKITKNFNYPYFSRNVAEYWRNWHMSLTSWLTDYIFMPLNIKFRNLGNLGILLAIVINMVAVGMWHGANWTFAVFGLYHGLLFIPLILSGAIFKKKKLKTNRFGLPSILDSFKILGTFLLVTLGLVIFRAENIQQAFLFIKGFFSSTLFEVSFSTLREMGATFDDIYILIIAMLFFIVEWIQKKTEHPLQFSASNKRKWLRWMVYYLLIILIIFLKSGQETFIYVQF